MGYSYNPFTRKLDKINDGPRLVASLPTIATQGDEVLNLKDDKIYVYYFGTWQAMGAAIPAPPHTYGVAKYGGPASSGVYA